MASISYIVTTYNRPQSQLNKAIQSIIAERLDGKNELIIVDDCSAKPAILDSSVLNAFGGQVQLIRNTENMGVIKSRNIGLIAARYEYILFLDDDDVVYSNRSRDLVTLMEGTSRAFVAARTRLFDHKNQFTIIPRQYDLPLTPLRYLCNLAHINGVIWRRSALLELGGFDNRVPYYGEQITMVLLILRGAEVLQIGTIVSQFQHISGGLTQNSERHNLIKKYLIDMVTIFLEEELPVDFRLVCEEAILFLNLKTSITLDEFLVYLSKFDVPG